LSKGCLNTDDVAINGRREGCVDGLSRVNWRDWRGVINWGGWGDVDWCGVDWVRRIMVAVVARRGISRVAWAVAATGTDAYPYGNAIPGICLREHGERGCDC